MTTGHSAIAQWSRTTPTLYLTWVAAMLVASSAVYGAPASRDVTFISETDQGERWLADGTYYDFDYETEQPQSDGHGIVTSNLCPPVPKRLPPGGCDVKACNSDGECADEHLKCCYNGCAYACLPEVKPPPHLDWIRQPVSRVQFGLSWLVPGPHDLADVEMCSTTPVDDDADPLVCPHGYDCSIDDPGNPEHGVPNRGHCVKIVDDVKAELYPNKSKDQDETSDTQGMQMDAQQVETDTATMHACDLGNHQLLLSGHSIVIEEKDCLCYEKKLICD